MTTRTTKSGGMKLEMICRDVLMQAVLERGVGKDAPPMPREIAEKVAAQIRKKVNCVANSIDSLLAPRFGVTGHVTS